MPIVKRAKGPNNSGLECAFSGWSKRSAPANKGAGSVARLAALSPSSDFFIFASGAWRLLVTRLTQWSHSLHRAPPKPSRTRARSAASSLKCRIFLQLSQCTRVIAYQGQLEFNGKPSNLAVSIT